jgi:hypothetical protein
MDNWFELALRFPKILQFSDDEMEQHFWCLDGRWSKQTKGLICKHGATGLNLNRNSPPTQAKGTCCPVSAAVTRRVPTSGMGLDRVVLTVCQ